MDNINIFEKATRQKLRFETNRGLLSVEDLWDLPLQARPSKPSETNLDDIAKDLYKQVKESTDVVSFVTTNASTAGETARMSFEIVKHIIDVKLDERKAAQEASARAAKKQQLMALIAQKEFDQLAGSDLEELKRQLGEL